MNKQESFTINTTVLERLAAAKRNESWTKSEFVQMAIERELDRIEQKEVE